MSSGLAGSHVDFVPSLNPSEVRIVHAKRPYRTDGLLAPGSRRARSGNEVWQGEMVWEEMCREDAIRILAQLERWGTVESFRIFVPGEEEPHGNVASFAQLDGLKVSGATATSTAAAVTFNAHASIPQTMVRGAGSWITDGFRVGMEVAVTSTAQPLNSGKYWVAAVAALTLTVTADSHKMTTIANDATANITGAFTHRGRELGVYTDPVVASTRLFKSGSLIGWVTASRYEMARVAEDFITDSAGIGTIQLAQYIRQAPAAASSVFTRYIPLRVALIEDPGYQIGPPVNYQFRIRFQEEPGTS